MTRTAHETLLRRLVRRHCPSVEFITGTVTGVIRSSKEAKKLSAVTYRLGQDTTVQSLEADLVIGLYPVPYLMSLSILILVSRLYRCCSRWPGLASARWLLS
jgi:hypothetical protein